MEIMHMHCTMTSEVHTLKRTQCFFSTIIYTFNYLSKLHPSNMINIKRTFLFLMVLFSFSACNDSRRLETIRQAEMLMQEQPDSALRVLQTIDRHSLKGKPLARYALIYSIAQDKSGLDVSNDSLLRIAHEYYSQHPDDSLYARSQYYMGKYLWLTAQTDSAYACFLKAKAASEEESCLLLSNIRFKYN